MPKRWKLVAAALVACAVGLAAAAALWRAREPARAAEIQGAPARPAVRPPAPPAPAAARTRWLAVGGGSGPDSNQLSLERDLALAAEVLAPHPGRILFAGGPGSHGVQVAERAGDSDPLLAELASLFSPRGGRDSRYRRTELAAHGPATRAHLDAELRELSRASREPLLLYFTAHGDIGAEPAENGLGLWGGGELSAADLAAALDGAGRPIRLVVGACFSGGFAEMVFRKADRRRGPASADRCGLFSTTWDLEASGCDPDPDRRNHQGYAVYFWNALRRRDRDGAPLSAARIDFDGDGEVSLLEAHSHVRIASRGIDVPTTTSERWLREAAPTAGPGRPVTLAEEDAVIAALAERLSLAGRERHALEVIARLEARLEALEDREESAAEAEEAHYRQVAGELLARWPVLDDPWHPDFASTIARHRDAIRAHLDTSESYRRYREVSAALDRLSREKHELLAERAPYERLARALETRELAGRLAAEGGREWQHFEALRRCESSVP